MTIREELKHSALAPALAVPYRLREVAKIEVRRLGMEAKWLFQSREMTNFTYDLSPINREHLAWFVALIANEDVKVIRGYLDEVEQDQSLHDHIQEATSSSDLKAFADAVPRYGRRIGWYALIRALKPLHVVETGTDKGIGSCVLASALLANGDGRLTTIDIDPDSGYLISGMYTAVTNRIVGDSLEVMKALIDVDFFLHDSDHSLEHEGSEFEMIAPVLTSSALVLSDNAHWSDRLPRWAEANGRKYLFFREDPVHWHAGSGIGIAW